MKANRWSYAIAVFLMILGMLLETGRRDAEALPPPIWKPLTVPSALPGQYCGGEPQDVRGLSLDLNAECTHVYPTSTGAAAIRQDAYGWVCKVPKQPDKGLNMQAACQRIYGTNAIATLVGIGVNDWRCLRPLTSAAMSSRFFSFPWKSSTSARPPLSPRRWDDSTT